MLIALCRQRKMTGYFPEELASLNATSHSEKCQQRGSERGKGEENGLRSEMGSESTEPCRIDTFHVWKVSEILV